MSVSWVLKTVTLSLLMLICWSITVVQLTTDNITTVMYNNSVYSTQFISSHSTFSCSLNGLFTYKQSVQNLQNNTPYQISISGVSSLTQLSISTQYGIMSPTLSQSSCNTNCTIQIRNFCPNPVSLFKYFDTVVFNIEGMKTFTYNVLCNKNFGTTTFQAGQFIIVTGCFIIIIFTAIYNKAYAFQTNGIEITYVYIICYAILQAIGGTLILVDPSVAQIVGDIAIWFIGSFGIIICFNEILFKFRIQILKRNLINIKRFGIRVTDVISFVIALALLLAWILADKNWIINDLISVCTIIAAIKIFKITSFKKALVFYLIEVTIQIIFVVLIDVLEKTSYELFLLNDFNNPLQIQLPTINPVYGLKCSWLPVSVTIFPGILLSYFYRFDKSRHTKIYLVTSSIAFFIGAMIWITITSLSTISFPFQSIAQPAMLGIVMLFAYNRKEIKVLWNGKFYDSEFKNRQTHEDDTYNYQMEVKKPDINQNFLQGLRISKQQESQNQPSQPNQRYDQSHENQGTQPNKRQKQFNQNQPNQSNQRQNPIQ